MEVVKKCLVFDAQQFQQSFGTIFMLQSLY